MLPMGMTFLSFHNESRVTTASCVVHIDQTHIAYTLHTPEQLVMKNTNKIELTSKAQRKTTTRNYRPQFG